MFQPDVELSVVTDHVSYMFHAVIGIDPLGNFREISGLNYTIKAEEYNELGRNHGPLKMPFAGGQPADPGQITLKWGMIIRSKLYDWMHDVKIGKSFRKDVFIFQLSRLRLPLRVYHLSGCWPIEWKGTELTVQSKEAVSEELTLVYDHLTMENLSAAAILGAAAFDVGSELANAIRPRSMAATPRPADVFYTSHTDYGGDLDDRQNQLDSAAASSAFPVPPEGEVDLDMLPAEDGTARERDYKTSARGTLARMKRTLVSTYASDADGEYARRNEAAEVARTVDEAFDGRRAAAGSDAVVDTAAFLKRREATKVETAVDASMDKRRGASGDFDGDFEAEVVAEDDERRGTAGLDPDAEEEPDAPEEVDDARRGEVPAPKDDEEEGDSGGGDP